MKKVISYCFRSILQKYGFHNCYPGSLFGFKSNSHKNYAI